MLTYALTQVVEGEHGTGKNCRIAGLKILGKTGTAQVVTISRKSTEEDESQEPDEEEYRRRDHAWFAAAVDHPDQPIAVAVLVEHGGKGSATAAPLARRVIERFYGGAGPSAEQQQVAQVGAGNRPETNDT